MRRLKVFSLLLGLIMLFTMFFFSAPAVGCASGSNDINNFAYGILTDTFNVSNSVAGTFNVCGTSSVTMDNSISHTDDILSGGPVSLYNSVSENGNIYSVGNVSLNNSVSVTGNIQTEGTVSSGNSVIVTGTITNNMQNLPVSVPSAVPQPDWTYYSTTSNPTVLTPANGKISSVYSQIHGGTYYINGNLTWDQSISSFPNATTIVVNGNITISNSIDLGSGGGLALIAYDGITVNNSVVLNGALLWAGGYDGTSNVHLNNSVVFTGDIVSKNGITIGNSVVIYQENVIPVAPPLKSAAPTVTGISPTNGTMAGGASVTITGTNFTGATAVKLRRNGCHYLYSQLGSRLPPLSPAEPPARRM